MLSTIFCSKDKQQQYHHTLQQSNVHLVGHVIGIILGQGFGVITDLQVGPDDGYL
jgi:hypothetical protein